MMKCIDFDAKFGLYTEKWVAENRHRFRNMDLMEEEIPELYLRWLNTPAEWLDGSTPGEWFNRYDNAEELVALMRAYQKQRISMPDPLLERVTDMGEEAVAPLMQLVDEYDEDRALAVAALNLLVEIGSSEPMNMCIEIIENTEGQNELTDISCELLSGLGEMVVEPLLERMEFASQATQEAFLDILCNFPGDERIYNYTVNAFLSCYDRRALYASFLSKLGDPRAVEPLARVLKMTDITYLDYIEIANAIEALGGELEETERKFDGDPYYESLKKMQ